MRAAKGALLGGGLVGVVIAVGAVSLSDGGDARTVVAGAPAATVSTPTENPGPSGRLPDGCQADIDPYYDTEAFEQRHPELLDRVTDDRDGRELCLTTEETVALEAEQASTEAARRAAGAYPPPGPPPAQDSESTPDPEGLVENPDPYVPAGRFVAVNGWEDQRGDTRLILEAGYRSVTGRTGAVTGEQGGVLVVWLPVGSAPWNVYFAPEGTPRLRIIEVKDDVALLEAADGRRLSFDVETGKLVEL